MSESHAPLAEADLTQASGLTLEDLTRLHESHILPAETAVTETEAEAEAEAEGEDALALNAPASRPADLRQALTLDLAGESYQLDQQDDLKHFQQQSQQLLGHDLPALMTQLGHYLHAQEQLQILYDRLALLSEQRGAASEIMQLARQIENFEKQLQQARFEPRQLQQQEQSIHELGAVLNAYHQVLQALQTLT
ncbi:MAG: hypothetical protein IGS03_08870 [Candidatus Sericytochromatia bacterium]|nr:hypothetical protein [Candidatus Sericytochromatia bacterium]